MPSSMREVSLVSKHMPELKALRGRSNCDPRRKSPYLQFGPVELTNPAVEPPAIAPP
jgi:hypothetical protein